MTFQELLILEEKRLIDEEILDDYWYAFYQMECRLHEEGKLIFFAPSHSCSTHTDKKEH